jgi:hypothetical protein
MVKVKKQKAEVSVDRAMIVKNKIDSKEKKRKHLAGVKKGKELPDLCNKIAYAPIPSYQPIIVGNGYFCKYCGNEVELEAVMGVKIGWMHKSGSTRRYIVLEKGMPDNAPRLDVPIFEVKVE